MEEYKYIGPKELADVLSDLMERTRRIKVMLWAGDAAAARSEMEEIRRHHEGSIIEALIVKAKVTSRARVRAIRAETTPKYLEERRKGWELEYLLRADIAKLTSVPDEASAALLAVAPVASLVTKLDRRISGETNQQLIFGDLESELLEGVPKAQIEAAPDQSAVTPTIPDFDPASGFRILVYSRGEETWEMRGYQLDPPFLDTAKLLAELKERSEVFAEEVEEDANDASWPIRIQGFSPATHFKLTVLEPGRFSLAIALKRGEDRDRWFRTILNAIARSQGGISPVEKLSSR